MDVPGMKLFQLFIIGLKKKYNDEKALCWSDFIFFLTSNSVTTSFNFKFFSAGSINEKKKNREKNTNKLMIDLSFVKLYFSSNINYVQFDHINSA